MAGDLRTGAHKGRWVGGGWHSRTGGETTSGPGNHINGLAYYCLSCPGFGRAARVPTRYLLPPRWSDLCAQCVLCLSSLSSHPVQAIFHTGGFHDHKPAPGEKNEFPRSTGVRCSRARCSLVAKKDRDQFSSYWSTCAIAVCWVRCWVVICVIW